MRRASGRRGSLCAETRDIMVGANTQTVIRIDREMKIVDNDRRDLRVFIDLGIRLCHWQSRWPERMAVDLINRAGTGQVSKRQYKLPNEGN